MPEFTFTKWGDSAAFGDPGGVVTWSLVKAGTPGVAAAFNTSRADETVNGRALFDFDIDPILARAFAAWSAFGDIQFLRVEDGGAPIGASDVADIRIAFAEIDGEEGEILGQAFFPTNDPAGGDMVIDADEAAFLSEGAALEVVVTHELGHALGLGHVTGVEALMNPVLGEDPSLRPDDIEGIATIYGPAPSGEAGAAFTLAADQPALTVAEAQEGLRLFGRGGDETITGAGGGEAVRGRGGDDLLFGRGGADDLHGGAGRDALRGGGGADTIRGAGGDDTLAGGRGTDALKGGGGADAATGGAGRDTVFGGAGDDRLSGGAGADVLRGGAGDDRLAGNAGADMLIGGAGADIFVFDRAPPADTILDLDLAEDRLDFSARAAVTGFADLTLTEGEAGAMISDGAGGAIVAIGVAVADLTEAAFIF